MFNFSLLLNHSPSAIIAAVLKVFYFQDGSLFTTSYSEYPLLLFNVLSSERTKRSPRLLLRLSGVLLLRYDERQFLAVLFQLPPRFTRLDPLYDSTLVIISTHDCLNFLETACLTKAVNGRICS